MAARQIVSLVRTLTLANPLQRPRPRSIGTLPVPGSGTLDTIMVIGAG
ncbi:hypothetical protein [Acetobacter malorum]|nr:hypothetical protein [Acetobacter malorum]